MRERRTIEAYLLNKQQILNKANVCVWLKEHFCRKNTFIPLFIENLIRKSFMINNYVFYSMKNFS